MISIVLPLIFTVTLGDVEKLGCPPYKSLYEITWGKSTFVHIARFDVKYDTFEVVLYPQDLVTIYCDGFEKRRQP